MIKNVHVVPTFNADDAAGNWKYDPCEPEPADPDIVIPPQPLKRLGVHGVLTYPVKWLACPDLSFQEETVAPLAGRAPVPAGSSPSSHTMQLGMFVGENGNADNGVNA
jgi:hypothetical protein